MKINCFSGWARFKAGVVAGAFGAILLATSGCASYPVAGGKAPSSAVSREHALNLAQLAASTVGGKVFTISATGSMKPTLDESSVVTVENVAYEGLRKGDIVVYRNAAGTPIIHRLYEQIGNRWLVLGDNNSAIDREAVTPENIVGRVCAVFYTSAGEASSLPTAMASR